MASTKVRREHCSVQEKGQLLPTEVKSIEEGAVGKPGEIRGVFTAVKAVRHGEKKFQLRHLRKRNEP